MTRYLAISFLVLTASCAGAAEKTLNKTFTVSSGGSLIVDADGATVHVSGNDSSQVTVRMTARGSEASLANVNLDATQNGNDVSVVMKRSDKGNWFFRSWSGDENIEVTVPRKFGINVQTGGGSVKLEDTASAAKLRTSGGDVTVKNLAGNLEAKTSGGGIRADSIRGDVEASTSGGDVRLLTVDGMISAHTSGGDVQCSLVGDNRGIRVSTSGGSIRLTLPRAVTGNLDASTSGGSITTELPVTTTEIRDGRLKGSLNGGGQPIEARTSGGDISLHAGS